MRSQALACGALTWTYIALFVRDSVRAHAALPWREALVEPKRFRDCYLAVAGAGAARWAWSQLLLGAVPVLALALFVFSARAQSPRSPWRAWHSAALAELAAVSLALALWLAARSALWHGDTAGSSSSSSSSGGSVGGSDGGGGGVSPRSAADRVDASTVSRRDAGGANARVLLRATPRISAAVAGALLAAALCVALAPHLTGGAFHAVLLALHALLLAPFALGQPDNAAGSRNARRQRLALLYAALGVAAFGIHVAALSAVFAESQTGAAGAFGALLSALRVHPCQTSIAIDSIASGFVLLPLAIGAHARSPIFGSAVALFAAPIVSPGAVVAFYLVSAEMTPRAKQH